MKRSLLCTMVWLLGMALNAQSITEIQETTDPSGASPLAGQTVSTEGIVTAAAGDNDLGYIYIQQQFADEWAGIRLFGNFDLVELNRGEKISLTGTVVEEFGETRINVSDFTVEGEGIINPVFLDPSTFGTFNLDAEKYEGMLVGFTNQPDSIYVSNSDLGFGEWGVSFNPNGSIEESCRVLTGRANSSTSSSLWVSYVSNIIYAEADGMMQVEPIVVQNGDAFYRMFGIIGQTFGTHKLLPRNNDDVVVEINDSFTGDNLTLTTLGTNKTLSAGGIITSDQKILAAMTRQINFLNQDPALARYNLNGSLDPSFGNGGVVIIESDNPVQAIGLGENPDGTYILGVSLSTGEQSQIGMYRFNADGSLDADYGINGLVTINLPLSFSAISELILMDNGQVVFGGSNFEDLIFGRINTDGTLDSEFGEGGFSILSFEGSPRPRDMKIDGSGRISCAITTTGNIFQDGHGAIRLNPDGSADSSFGIDGISTIDLGEPGTSVCVEPIGNDLLIGGNIHVQWSAPHVLARINQDGLLDAGFGSEGSVTGNISGRGREIFSALTLLSNGNICAAGIDADTINVLGNSGRDLITAIYSPQGVLLGSETLELALSTEVHSVLEDDQGIIYIIGKTDFADFTFGSAFVARMFPDQILTTTSYRAQDFGIKVFPNPFVDQVRVELSLSETTLLGVDVIALDGSVLQTITGQQNPKGLDLDLNKLPRGFYLLRIKTNQGDQVVRIVK